MTFQIILIDILTPLILLLWLYGSPKLIDHQILLYWIGT